MKEQLLIKSIKLSNESFLGSVVEFVKSGKQVKINIAGDSMRPFLFDGDVILLNDISFDSVRLGDVLLCKYFGKYVLHRVVKIGGDVLYIAGDNNIHQIEIIKRDDVCAIAITLLKDAKEIDLRNKVRKIMGLTWYYLRPVRRVFLYFLHKKRKDNEVKK